MKTAIILAGGLGTRLRPLTYETPKPLIKMRGDVTLTELNIGILKKAGITNIILSVSYMADKIQKYFGDGSHFGVSITYAIEEKPMGTAGPLMLIDRPDDTFIMINGDNLCEIDFLEMYEAHKQRGGVATLALTEVDDPSSYGVADLDGDQIKGFVEKPQKGEAPSNYISAGYYILEPEVFDYVPNEEFVMVEKAIWPTLAAEGKLFGFKLHGFWSDVGTLERYDHVRGLLESGELQL